MRYFKGIAVSKGFAVGPIHLYVSQPTTHAHSYAGRSVEEQLSAYKLAHTKAMEELAAIQARLGKEQGAIFDAHCEILNDAVMEEEILTRVCSGASQLDEAIDAVYSEFAAILESSTDPVFQERARDMEDVRDRLLRLCTNSRAAPLECQYPCILAAKDLLPSDTASLDPDKILAIVTEQGGPTSHTAIIARSYGIPAVLGVGPFLTQLVEGEPVAVDACVGKLITEADDAVWDHYRQAAAAYARQIAETAKYLQLPVVTQDGVHVDITLNIASASPKGLSLAPHVDGVGLFRTEFLFLGRQEPPGEEEQVAIYRTVLSAFQGKPVVLRTLDIGGDKQTECLPLPHEDNPFLGKRALRLCFDCLDIFRTQLRAALRASTAGSLWLMLPMVGCLDDIRRARKVLEKVQAELDDKGITYAPDVKLGIMVEIPSIALLAEEAAREADFASIGSNDLCQYLMAADRLNPEVAGYYQPMNPAMFRLIRSVVSAFTAQEKPISLCGELAGDPFAAAVLVGMGMRKLSMNADAVPRVKKILCGISLEQAERAARQVCTLGTEQEVLQYLKAVFSHE